MDTIGKDVLEYGCVYYDIEADQIYEGVFEMIMGGMVVSKFLTKGNYLSDVRLFTKEIPKTFIYIGRVNETKAVYYG